MLKKKTGFPKENEIVMCTVTKIQFHSVFVSVDEYGKQGMIHISEISPGRIRNLRDYVKEGKVIVCKILRVNKERGYIDLSLRRVNENQRRAKINFMKQEQIAEKIIDFVAKKHKKKAIEVYDKVMVALVEDYEGLYPFFEDFVDDQATFEDIELDKEIISELEEIIKQRIKPPEVTIDGEISLVCFDSNGLDTVKKAFKTVEKVENLEVKYIGGGKYSLSVKDSNYPDAEVVLKKALKSIEATLKKADYEFSFERNDNK